MFSFTALVIKKLLSVIIAKFKYHYLRGWSVSLFFYITKIRHNILFLINQEMKKTAPPNTFKSNNFANALFSIKDMQADYQQFNGSPIVTPPVIPVQKKPLVQPKSVTKPNYSLKPEIKKDLKPKQFGQKVESNLNKQTFKIAAGKQFQKSVKFSPLNIIQCVNKVHELSMDKKKSQWQYNVFCDGIPADQIVPKPEVSFCFNAEDIKQGQLGNCYFVAALASLAVNPWILKDRIPKFKEYGCKSKSFQVNLFESGKLISMAVDNLFPNIYCKPVENDISPMVLQKAYAQSYGNFDVINIGHSNDALRDLTGANTVYVELKNKQQLIKDLKMAFDNQFGVVIASKPQKVHPSLSPKHSYIVLGYQIIQGQLFVRMRDPRGWTKAFFEVPNQLVTLPELGIFWVDQKNLQESFQVLTVCKLKRNYNYFFKTFRKKELNKNRGGLLLKTHSPAKVCISIHQKHKKFFDENFSYDILKVLIGQVQRQKENFEVVKTIKADFNAQQVCSMEVELKAGKQYIILGEIGNKKAKQNYPRQIFTISVYSDTDELEFEAFSGDIQVSPFLTNYIVENKNQFQESSSQQGLFRYRGALFGYVCMLYQNKGNKNVLETIDYPNVKNVEITEKRVKLAPHTSKLLMHPIGPQKNCSFQCSTSTKTVYS